MRPLASSLALSVILLGACADDRGDLCQRAADHLARCAGATPPEASSCDPDTADTLLASSCQELGQLAEDGKADGWCGDLGIGVKSQKAFISLAEAGSEEEAWRIAEEIRRTLYVTVMRGGATWFVVLGSCPMDETVALLEAIRLKDQGFWPSLLMTSQEFPGCSSCG
jgi:hypothetical protein